MPRDRSQFSISGLSFSFSLTYAAIVMADLSVGRCFTLVTRRINSKWPSGQIRAISTWFRRLAAFHLGRRLRLHGALERNMYSCAGALIPNRALAPLCPLVYATPWAGF